MPRRTNPLAFAALALGMSAIGCGANGAESAADAGPADAPLASCDRQGFTPTGEAAERDFELEVLFYTGANATERFNVDFYFSLGATDGAQQIAFSGEGLDTCAECVFLRTGCGSLLCETTFMAQTGTLTIEAMGGEGESFVGSLQDAVFREVEIDSGTQETTVVTDGASWCLDDYTFDVTVTVP